MYQEATSSLQGSGLVNNTAEPVADLQVKRLVQAAVSSGVYQEIRPSSPIAGPRSLVTGSTVLGASLPPDNSRIKPSLPLLRKYRVEGSASDLGSPRVNNASLGEQTPNSGRSWVNIPSPGGQTPILGSPGSPWTDIISLADWTPAL